MAVTYVVLLCLTFVTSSYGQYFTETCDFSPPCKKIPTLNVTLSEYASYSPLYEPIGINYEDDSDIETVGACVTFSQITDSTYLVFRNVRTKNGSTNLELYMAIALTGQPGAFRLQGLYSNTGNTTSVLNGYVVASGCESCSHFFLLYACYLLGNEAHVHPVDDFVYSAFSSPSPPASCLAQYERLVDQLGFSHAAGFARASRGLPPCVTRFYNNTCINADKVDPANAMSFP